MTAPINPAPGGLAARLREQLADQLQNAGLLRSGAWRAAVAAVPREVFAPEFFRQGSGPQGTVWTPVTPATEGADTLLEEVYKDQTLVTQLDGGVHPGDVGGPVTGSPSSSSTLPGLVVRMLEDLEPQDGDRILEIGTGTGYSTALMCHRLGGDHITSIEYDPAAAARARTAITAAGYTPRLVQGDGLLGDSEGAPYDRLIATCSVRTIPGPWLHQVKPGGTILTTLSGWLYGSGLVRLTVGDNNTAEGRFLPGTVSFMIARPQAAPGLGDISHQLRQPAEMRPARHGPEVLKEWVPRFLAQVAAPGAQYQRTRVAGGPWLTHAIDIRDGSFATLAPDGNDAFLVHQGGPNRLWDDIEAAVDAWRAAGSPPQTAFTLTVNPNEQRVDLGTPDGPSWVLPT
ncbi:ATP-grasp peptide maturase system methyltransferase [Streptomyces yaizuensis]|uniref:Protein-L-isoaspartate O-methyltransferase n=1 Tax=Streptomyces yaizuensis TaxID=2989713 RepID=A0ABQ5NYB1_9ACTN|nr:ATP-grasp peptide maturase system methyltransferase [Streptomyces sp. YSPA8]GLF94941.1 ATP-grasp peptide maturase system methyltransferase [Streptomyces sp. YSPA8]